MSPLALTAFTASSAIGRGLAATLDSLRAQRTGLARCSFETVTLELCVGEVPGVDAAGLPAPLREFECRNNRLAWLALAEDGFAEAVRESAARHGSERIGIFSAPAPPESSRPSSPTAAATAQAARCRRSAPTAGATTKAPPARARPAPRLAALRRRSLRRPLPSAKASASCSAPSRRA